jgi:hypothetical protein
MAPAARKGLVTVFRISPQSHIGRDEMKAVSLILLACGCLAPPIEKPPITTVGEVPVDVVLTRQQNVDILFMIDNSNSMAPKQAQLKQRFPGFISKLRDFDAAGLSASYHLGVVTSDLGAGHSAACARNDGGRLNITDRTNVDSPVDCGLQGGLRFIDYNQLAGTANVVGSVESAFQCIATVGDAGCGFEHQLESVHRALAGNVPENQGFLRQDAVLVVVFLTDEDDCSAPPDSDLFDTTKNGTDYSQPGNYGPFNSFRCTQFGVVAGGEPLPWPTVGEYSDPQPAPFSEMPGPGKLFDVNRYLSLFGPGGVKKQPERQLMLVGITAPPLPFRTLLAVPNMSPQKPCSTYDGTTCSVQIAPACSATAQTNYTGDPAVRLHAVVSGAANHDEGTSICADSYDQALEKVSDFIKKSVGDPCLATAIDHPKMPDCVIEETVNGETTILPWCGKPGGATHPCWQLVDRPDCPAVVDLRDNSTQQLGLEIVRDQEPQGVIEDHAVCASVTASM